jgi:ubiquinone/menaquinone biosynthesis C-methylase UbiE
MDSFRRKDPSYAFPRHRTGEAKRLRLLEEYVDGLTFRTLGEAGVGPGWRCADLGAGSGSVTRWLSRVVGPEGQVDAYDLDISLLPDAGNVRPIACDLAGHRFTQRYDLVFCRFLLVHLGDPMASLRRFSTALADGGTICVVESDYSDWEMPAGQPHMARLKAAYLAAAGRRGWDTGLGAALPSMLHRAGLENVTAESFCRYDRGGSTGNELVAESIEALRSDLVATGLIESTDVEAAIRTLRDPALGMRYITTWACWGTLPRSGHPGEPR